MWKRLTVLLMCLLMALPVLAEEVPTLPGQFTLDDLPENLTFDVYTGPDDSYLQAAGGRARVSTNGPIQCYGRLGDTGWVMIRYEVSASQVRVGCINLRDYPDMWQRKRELTFAAEAFLLPGRVQITDDPYRSGSALGTVSGRVTLLAWRGNDWAYVEGVPDGEECYVRGFIPRTALYGAALPEGVSISPYAGDRYMLDKDIALNLPDGAQAEGMSVYPLADGTWLIDYRCQDSDKVWLRVISGAGKKLWAKSVDRRYLHQITLTQTGFICETFDNSECDSGMRYTYTCRGRKWASRKVSWINEPDRAYADNTASFTLLRHTFREGGYPVPFELTNRLTGATLLSDTHTFKPFLYEADGSLLLLDEAADGTLTLRIFSADLATVACVAAPAELADRWVLLVRNADHARNAVYFFTHVQDSWKIWRFDRETQTFADAPVEITLPMPAALLPMGASPGGRHSVILVTDYGSYFCDITEEGDFLLHQSLPGRVVWTDSGDGVLLVLLQDSEGEFRLQYYSVSEG